jgi:hypothetical protein
MVRTTGAEDEGRGRRSHHPRVRACRRARCRRRLAALGHRDAGVVEPGEEPGGGQQLGARVAGRGPSGCVLRRALAQPAQDPPGGVGVQQPAMLGLFDAGDE